MTLPVRPPAERRRPSGAAGRRPLRPLHHRRRGARPQPHHDLAPHRRARGVDRRPGPGARRGRLGADRSRPRGARGRRDGRVRGPLARPPTPAGLARHSKGVVRISATDGFSAYIAAPAAAQVQRRHPKVAVEIVAATRRATQQRSGLDIEVVVGEPQVHRAEAIRLGDYCLGAVRVPRLSDRTRLPAEHRGSGALSAWSTSSTRCFRSTISTWHRASLPPCGNRSRPPTSSSTSRPPAPRRVSACCRASWPTGTTTWSGCYRRRSSFS